MTPRAASPGDAMLHPVTLAALAVLVVNDHVLKWWLHDALSGKLSDVAILVVGPLALHAACERLRARVLSRRSLEIIVMASAFVYSLEKTVPEATEVYRLSWGALRFPVDVMVAVIQRAPWPGYAPVAAVTDPTDLLALPALALPLRVHRARAL